MGVTINTRGGSTSGTAAHTEVTNIVAGVPTPITAAGIGTVYHVDVIAASGDLITSSIEIDITGNVVTLTSAANLIGSTVRITGI